MSSVETKNIRETTSPTLLGLVEDIHFLVYAARRGSAASKAEQKAAVKTAIRALKSMTAILQAMVKIKTISANFELGIQMDEAGSEVIGPEEITVQEVQRFQQRDLIVEQFTSKANALQAWIHSLVQLTVALITNTNTDLDGISSAIDEINESAKEVAMLIREIIADAKNWTFNPSLLKRDRSMPMASADNDGERAGQANGHVDDDGRQPLIGAKRDRRCAHDDLSERCTKVVLDARSLVGLALQGHRENGEQPSVTAPANGEATALFVARSRQVIESLNKLVEFARARDMLKEESILREATVEMIMAARRLYFQARKGAGDQNNASAQTSQSDDDLGRAVAKVTTAIRRLLAADRMHAPEEPRVDAVLPLATDDPAVPPLATDDPAAPSEQLSSVAAVPPAATPSGSAGSDDDGSGAGSTWVSVRRPTLAAGGRRPSVAGRLSQKVQRSLARMTAMFDTSPVAGDGGTAPEGQAEDRQQQRARQRAEALRELLNSEIVYYKQLRTLEVWFVTPIKERRLANVDPAVDRLLDAVLTIANLTKIILEELKKQLVLPGAKHADSMRLSTRNSGTGDTVGSVFVKVAPLLAQYHQYIELYDIAIDKLQTLTAAGGPFADQLAEFRQRSGSGNLLNFLILPIQRLPRYELLLANVLKFSDEGADSDYAELAAALKKVREVNEYVNARKREEDNRRKMASLAKAIVFGRSKAHDLAKERLFGTSARQYKRWFIREGPMFELNMATKSGSARGSRGDLSASPSSSRLSSLNLQLAGKKKKLYYYFLFSDVLVKTVKKKRTAAGLFGLDAGLDTAGEASPSAGGSGSKIYYKFVELIALEWCTIADAGVSGEQAFIDITFQMDVTPAVSDGEGTRSFAFNCISEREKNAWVHDLMEAIQASKLQVEAFKKGSKQQKWRRVQQDLESMQELAEAGAGDTGTAAAELF